MKCRYGRDEGGEGGDFMAGKDSFLWVRQWGLAGIWGERGGGSLLGLKLVGKNQIGVAK